MYSFFVQDTVLRASLGICLCCRSGCSAATKKLPNKVNSLFWSETFFSSPNKNKLLPVFPCSPLVALQAPLFFSVLARELPQFQQRGRLLAKPPPLELSSGTTDQPGVWDWGAAVRQQAKAQQAAGAKMELFEAVFKNLLFECARQDVSREGAIFFLNCYLHCPWL